MIDSKNNRRTFFKVAMAAVGAGVASSSLLAGNTEKKTELYPLPPGAVSLDRFKSKCTACQLCVNHCPTGVLKASLFENGLTGMMQPILKFDVEQFCEYECKTCIDVCPNDALVKLSLEEKKVTQIGEVQLILEECVLITDNEDCGACAEHCPTAALKMVPWKDGLTKPEIVNPEMCIGCGGCESICPTNKRAIFIARNEVHIEADKPKVEVQEEVEIDGFGF